MWPLTRFFMAFYNKSTQSLLKTMQRTDLVWSYTAAVMLSGIQEVEDGGPLERPPGCGSQGSWDGRRSLILLKYRIFFALWLLTL